MYEWVKALHIIAVISWMAGMLYLPRLFVYHCEAEVGSKQSETFKVMERRLLKADHQSRDDRDLARRALSGLGRALVLFALAACQSCVLVISAVRRPRIFPAGLRILLPTGIVHSQKFYRIINEVPTVSDDRDRHPGGGETVLGGNLAQEPVLLSFLRRAKPIFYICPNPTPRRRM